MDGEAIGDKDVPMTSPKEKPKPMITVKKWNAVALWSWNITVENCAICRVECMQPCLDCQAQAIEGPLTKECTLAWGTCNHAFHFHCISKWLKTKQCCPLCNAPWEFQRYGRGEDHE